MPSVGEISRKLNNAVNLTPHDVVLFDSIGKEELMTFKASGKTLRVDFSESKVSKAIIAGSVVEVAHAPRAPKSTNWDDLPDEIRRAPAIIVSAMTADVVWPTMDPVLVFVPDSGPESVVRDDGGKILGVKRFLLYDGEA